MFRASGPPDRCDTASIYHVRVRAVVLEVDERQIAERHHLGLDKRDEMWEGVLHMVPPASDRHQAIQGELYAALRPIVRRRGWLLRFEEGIFASEKDYRVPDLVVFPPGSRAERGVVGPPELVVEIRSPGDESYEKRPWYFARGATEVLIIERDGLGLDLQRTGQPVAPDAQGSIVLETLGVTITPFEGTLLVDGAPLEF